MKFKISFIIIFLFFCACNINKPENKFNFNKLTIINFKVLSGQNFGDWKVQIERYIKIDSSGKIISNEFMLDSTKLIEGKINDSFSNLLDSTFYKLEHKLNINSNDMTGIHCYPEIIKIKCINQFGLTKEIIFPDYICPPELLRLINFSKELKILNPKKMTRPIVSQKMKNEIFEEFKNQKYPKIYFPPPPIGPTIYFKPPVIFNKHE